MTQMISSPAPIAGVPRTNLMRATDALASATATHERVVLPLAGSSEAAQESLACLADTLTLPVTP